MMSLVLGEKSLSLLKIDSSSAPITQLVKHFTLVNKNMKCENPRCSKEHDGSYGSGRFCSDHCRRVYIGL